MTDNNPQQSAALTKETVSVYAIKTEGDTESLAKVVNAAIVEGWEAQGGVCSYTCVERDGYGNISHYVWFAQALIRRRL